MDRSASSTVNKITDYDKLQQILDKVRDLKQTLAIFFAEYEHGQPAWPTILDEMNTLSSQITTLRASMRTLLPSLRGNSIIPMRISPDVDPNVEHLTEKRLSIFNHDFMPQLLRTKNLPEIEEREKSLSANAITSTSHMFGRSTTVSNDVTKYIQEYNAILGTISDVLRHTKEITDRSEKQFDLQRFTNQVETKRLLDAMNNGTGLKAPDTSSSPITTNEAANLNQPMPAPNPRNPVLNVRIKTMPKPNR